MNEPQVKNEYQRQSEHKPDVVTEQAPPVHEAPQPAPQPMQELVAQMERAWSDIGGLISRTDQLEATVRRLDRQAIMMVGTLALVLYVTRQALSKVQELNAGS